MHTPSLLSTTSSYYVLYNIIQTNVKIKVLFYHSHNRSIWLKNLTLFLPLFLASYKAWSTLLISCFMSNSSEIYGTPKLWVILCPDNNCSLSIIRLNFSAITKAFALLIYGQIIKNSSPPHLPTLSTSLVKELIRLATFLITSSSTRWLYLSFTCLNLSISATITEVHFHISQIAASHLIHQVL